MTNQINQTLTQTHGAQTADETPMTSEGFGLTSGLTSAQIAEVTNAIPVRTVGFETSQDHSSPIPSFNINGLRERGIELANSLQQQTRANPWLTVGLVGVGALALGYVFGRRMPRSSVAPEVRGIARENDRYEKFAGYAD